MAELHSESGGLGITELASAVESTPATLKVYEKLGLLHLPRDRFGRRRGGPVEIARIREIQAERAASRLSGLKNQRRDVTAGERV